MMMVIIIIISIYMYSASRVRPTYQFLKRHWVVTSESLADEPTVRMLNNHTQRMLPVKSAIECVCGPLYGIIFGISKGAKCIGGPAGGFSRGRAFPHFCGLCMAALKLVRTRLLCQNANPLQISVTS